MSAAWGDRVRRTATIATTSATAGAIAVRARVIFDANASVASAAKDTGMA